MLRSTLLRCRVLQHNPLHACTPAHLHLHLRYSEGEVCPYGEKCTFAHGESELAGRGEGEEGAGNPLYKTMLCEQFREAEYCERAERCSFAHGADELRTKTFKAAPIAPYKTTLCRNWQSGSCTYGSVSPTGDLYF